MRPRMQLWLSSLSTIRTESAGRKSFRPNSGRFLKSVAKNRSRICVRFPWISSERRLCLPPITPLPLSFPKSFVKTPQRHYSRSITLVRPRTGAPSSTYLTSKDAAAAGKSSPTTQKPATASRMTISRR